MADNYIERKMEEHSSRAPKPVSRRPAHRAVFITDVFAPDGEEALKRCISAGDCRIAFAAHDYARGSRLAQATGARFYCITRQLSLDWAISDARHHFAPLSLEIII
ncbi:MAG: hypothetical protein ACI31E_04250 [Muribaculaceae bacterium]